MMLPTIPLRGMARMPGFDPSVGGWVASLGDNSTSGHATEGSLLKAAKLRAAIVSMVAVISSYIRFGAGSIRWYRLGAVS